MLPTPIAAATATPAADPTTTRRATRMAGRVGGVGGAGWAARVPAAVSFLLWLAAGAVVAFGVLHGWGQRADVALPAPPSVPWAVDTSAVARALGARPASSVAAVAQPVADSRYTLLGVVAPTGTDSQSGVALIAVDGQRPQPHRVGAPVDGRWRVSAVHRRTVELEALVLEGAASGAAPARQTLSLPEAGTPLTR